MLPRLMITAALSLALAGPTAFADPIAVCISTEVCAPAASCLADATIDAGSTSSGGGPITLTQTPSGPYPLGTTLVTLHVSDGTGSAECLASVTVRDCTAPAVTCPAPITAECDLPFSADADPGAPSASDACSTPSTGVPERSIREGDPFVMTGAFEDYALDHWTATVNYGDGAGAQPLVLESDRSFYLAHTYADDGRFPLTVAVTDDSGAVGSDTSEIIVRNVVPVVSAGADAALDEGQLFISAGSFFDPGADTWTAMVDYGDGSGAHPLALAANHTFALAHVYPLGGEFVVTVTVTDDDGGSGAGTAHVSVRSVPPIVSLPGAIATDLAEGDTLVKAGSFTDPGLGPWTATADYGDGTGAQPLALAADNTFLLSHRYRDNGFFVVTVSVRDRSGATGTATHQANVRNISPVVSAGPDVHVDEESPLTISGTIFDPGADVLTATLDWGDTGGSVPIAIAPDGSFTATHVYTIHETYTVRITAFDDDGGFGTDEVHVVVDNLAPIVELGAPAFITEGATFTQAVELSDRDFDVIEARVDFGDGSAVQFIDLGIGGGSFLLSHLYADEGLYTLTVAVTDQDAAVTTRTLPITVAGVAPAVALSGAATIPEGSTYFASGSFTDPGADTWTATIDFGDGARAIPIHPGKTFDATHVYADNGVFTISAAVTDDDGLSGSASRTIEVLNVAPAISLSVSPSVIRGDTFTASGSFTDPGADTWTATVDYGDGAGPHPLALAADKSFALSHVYATLGAYTLRVVIADDDGASTTADRPINVSNIICPAGTGDCDLDFANGCEASLTTIQNCGACNHACSSAHGTPSCANGACAISCDLWFADCDHDASNGCESAIGPSATCGGSCPLGYSNCDGDATNGCETSGRADCDGDLTNGCEASVASDPASCGACGNVCPSAPNALATCSASRCGLACAAGFANCDGDASNGCETAGRCACVAPFEDCDGDPSNGCEADLSADAGNCGRCGSACTFAHASGVCSAGACSMGACDPLFGDCNSEAIDGCETALALHAQNCGACGLTCPSGQACEDGECKSLLTEVCNGADDDGDGQVDEGLTVACHTACGAGVMTCSGGRWSACSAPQPAAETCNGRDDDCDGIADNGIFPGCAFPNCSNVNGTPPELALEAPAEDAVVGSVIDVRGSIADTDLDSWIVDFVPAGGGDAIVLATGSSPVAAGGTLARLVPGVLPAGTGDLRVRALDCTGALSQSVRSVKIESDELPGAMQVAFTDLEIEMAGIPITVTRSYDSRDRATLGDFGHGWSLSVTSKTKMSRNRPLGQSWAVVCGFFGARTATELTGHVVEVRLGKASYRFRPVVTGLSPIAGGCTGTMSFTQVGGTGRASLLGSIFVFHDNGMPSHFRDDLGSPELADLQPLALALPNGRTYQLDRSGRLQSMADASGNQLTVTSNAISHSSGASLSLARNAAGAITSITDPAGRALVYEYSASGDLLRMTDRTGAASTYTYDHAHDLLRWDDPEGHTPMRAEYGADGRVTALANGNQASTTMAYDDANASVLYADPAGADAALSFDASGHPSAAAADGAESQLTYDAEGRLVGTSRTGGGSTSKQYDAHGELVREVDAEGAVTTHVNTYAGDRLAARTTTGPDGAVTLREWNGSSLLAREVEPGGAEKLYTYDARGLMLTRTIHNGAATEVTGWTYDAAGRVASVTDPLGRTTSYTRDALGKITGESRTFTPAGGAPITVSTTSTYDANGKRTSTTDALGRVRTTSFDSHGRATSTGGGEHGAQQLERDPSGNLTSTVDALGGRFAMSLDARGNNTSSVDASGVRMSLAYDEGGRITSIASAGQPAATRAYDEAGRITSELSATGDSVSYSYDDAGRITETLFANGTSNTTSYDAAGRVASTTDALERTTAYTHDTAGNVTAVSFADGTSQHFTYDARGRRTSFTDETGRAVHYEYDAAGQLSRYLDQDGHAWLFEYDELGGLTRLQDPLGNARVYVRNAGGQLVREELPNGRAIQIEYDAAGRKSRETNGDGTSVSYGYDAAGRMIEKRLSTGAVHSYAYDAAGRPAGSTGPEGARSMSYDANGRLSSMTIEDGTRIAYAYDADGRRTSMSWGGRTVEWSYDGPTRISRVRDPSGDFFYTYDAAGNVLSILRPNGTRSSYDYDRRDRVTLVEHRAANGAVFDRTVFTYDAAGRMTSATRTGLAATPVSYDYDYDARGFLIFEQRTEGTSVETVTYTYDAAGNRDSETDASGTRAYTYDPDGRLLAVGPTTFAYDDAGRVISAGDDTFAWDAAGRLISASAPAGSATYGYDANDLRIRTTAGGASTTAVWDDPRRSVPLLAGERSSAGDRAYTWGNGLLHADQSFVHEDGRRNIDALSDSTGVPTDRFEYSAFGVPRAASPISLGYRSELTDPLTGLQYLRSRYYQPSTGRFLSRDSFAVSPFNPASFTRYGYADNDPLGKIDPSGLSPTIPYPVYGAVVGGMFLTMLLYLQHLGAQDLASDSMQAPPDFPGRTALEKSVVEEIFWVNKTMVMPRLLFLSGGGRIGVAGNQAAHFGIPNFRCFCLNTKASKMIRDWLLETGVVGAAVARLGWNGASAGGAHFMGELTMPLDNPDSALKVYIDDWWPKVPPVAPAPTQPFANPPGPIDENVECWSET